MQHFNERKDELERYSSRLGPTIGRAACEQVKLTMKPLAIWLNMLGDLYFGKTERFG